MPLALKLSVISRGDCGSRVGSAPTGYRTTPARLAQWFGPRAEAAEVVCYHLYESESDKSEMILNYHSLNGATGGHPDAGGGGQAEECFHRRQARVHALKEAQ